MRPLWCVLALMSAGGCRRHHAPSEGASELPAATGNELPAASAAAAASLDLLAPTAAAAPPPGGPRMPDGGTLNGDARGPRAADFNRVVDAALPRIRQCFDSANLPAGQLGLVVHYIVEPPGYTGGLTVQGTAPAAVQACARAVVNDMKFPEFHGNKVANDLPFTWTKTEKATRTEIWDAAPAPTPP